MLVLGLGFSYVRAGFRVRISDYVGVLHQSSHKPSLAR